MGSLIREGSIGAILHKSRIITEKDIETALEEQKRTGLRFGEVLVSLGIVMQEDIDWALSHQLDIPYVRIRKEAVDPAAVGLVPASVARKFKLFPLIKTGDELRVAIADPLNTEAVAEVAHLTGCTVSISMGLLREIREMQDYFYGNAVETGAPGFSSTCFSPQVIEEINNDATGARLMERLLLHLLREGLSSLSFKALKDTVTVTGRRGKATHAIGTLSLEHYGKVISTMRKKAGMVMGEGASAKGSLTHPVDGERELFLVVVLMG